MHQTQLKPPPRTARRPYSPPHLVLYGNVAELTRNGSGSKTENGSSICGKKAQASKQSC
jgi:hypothetical protein